jgi:hypothetical protein
MWDSTASSVTTRLNAVRLGITAGIFTCLAYPLLIFLPLPSLATAALAGCIGPALALASYGLKTLLDLERPTVSSAAGLLLNALAGAMFSAMLLVQLAVKARAQDQKVAPPLAGVWLGMDVAWDAYIGLGTLCFAIAMLRHPRFGRAFAYSGLAIAVSLLALNFYTFPTPPGSAGLIDLGPAAGLWYLIVTIQTWRSMAWAKGRAASA